MLCGFKVCSTPLLLFYSCEMCGCSERDEFESALNDLQKQYSHQNSSYEAVVRERDQLSSEVS